MSDDITAGQQGWLERIHKAFGDPFTELHYGIGYQGCARMVVNDLVFVVDRETGRCSVEIASASIPSPLDVKETMAWRDSHGLDGSYDATVGALSGSADLLRDAERGK